MADDRRAVVVGIPGVGKSTVLSHAMKMLKESGTEARHVVFGTIMLEKALNSNYVSHRDELRKLPVETQKTLQLQAASEISSIRAEVLIVDTHLLVTTKEGYLPGLPAEILSAIKPTNLFLIEASPAEILERRASDSTRVREISASEKIGAELALARSFLTTCSVLSGAPLKILNNEQGMAEMAAKGLVEALSVR